MHVDSPNSFPTLPAVFFLGGVPSESEAEVALAALRLSEERHRRLLELRAEIQQPPDRLDPAEAAGLDDERPEDSFHHRQARRRA
jgi:hypothetical protein